MTQSEEVRKVEVSIRTSEGAGVWIEAEVAPDEDTPVVVATVLLAASTAIFKEVE